MNKKTVSGIMLTLLVIGMLTLAFNIQPVKSDWTWTEPIYIRTDGSVDPNTAPISTVDNVTYTLTDNIVGDVPKYSEAIVVQRDNIVVDGAGYSLQGLEAWGSKGVALSGRSNVTIKNMKIKSFWAGVQLGSSDYNNIFGNKMITNGYGITLYESSNNTISGNNITKNWWMSIGLERSSNNTISGNNITKNYNVGMLLAWSSNHNIVSGNSITNGTFGIYLYCSSDNEFYHNNLVGNTQQAHVHPSGYANFWDNGYPSGGNYWSDQVRVDNYSGINQDEPRSDGITDEPYIINATNQDNYPLMNPWTPIDELEAEIEELGSKGEIDNQGIVKSLIAKLNVAQKLVDSGKIGQAKTILQAFISQVHNLSGIHITPEAADILIESAEYIISHL